MEKAITLAFFVGFVTASPLGPVGLLCLRRFISFGNSSGLISALGIACAYSFWTYVVVHGLSNISNLVEEDSLILEMVIGLFFLLYGLYGIFTTTTTKSTVLRRKKGISIFLSTLLVVFLNPGTFIMFSAIFALLGLAKKNFVMVGSLEIATSVFIGTLCFWSFTMLVIQKIKDSLTDLTFNTISRFSSYAITFFGGAILVYSLVW